MYDIVRQRTLLEVDQVLLKLFCARSTHNNGVLKLLLQHRVVFPIGQRDLPDRVCLLPRVSLLGVYSYQRRVGKTCRFGRPAALPG
jgi:hypothetical protein